MHVLRKGVKDDAVSYFKVISGMAYAIDEMEKDGD